MLTAPWFLLISIFCGFLAVSFVGDLSVQKLDKTMHLHLAFYYHPENAKSNFSRRSWDTVQLYVRLSCKNEILVKF